MNSVFIRVVLNKFVCNPEQSDAVGAKNWLEVLYDYDDSQTIQDLVEIIKKAFIISTEIALFTSDGFRLGNNISLRILSHIKINEGILVQPAATKTANMSTQTEDPSSPPTCDNKIQLNKEEAENLDDGNQETESNERCNQEDSNNTKDADNDSGMSDSGEDEETLRVSEASKNEENDDVESEDTVIQIDEHETFDEVDETTQTGLSVAINDNDIHDESAVEISESETFISNHNQERISIPANKRKVTFSEDSDQNKLPPRKKIALTVCDQEIPSPTPSEIGSTSSDFDLSSDSVSNKSSVESRQATPVGRKHLIRPGYFKTPSAVRVLSGQNGVLAKKPRVDSVFKSLSIRKRSSCPNTRSRSADRPLTPFVKASTSAKDLINLIGQEDKRQMSFVFHEQSGWCQVAFEDLTEKRIGAEVKCQYFKKAEENGSDITMECNMVITDIKKDSFTGIITSVNQEKADKNLDVGLLSITKESMDNGESKVFVFRDDFTSSGYVRKSF